MPDSASPYSWQQLVRDAIQTVQLLALAWIASLGANNSNKLEAVETRQVEVKEDLEAKAVKEARANEVKLYEAWKNLDWLAQDSGRPADKAKAAEAKRVYDEFVAHQNGH